MLKNISRPQLIVAWLALIVVLFALTVIRGAQPSVSAGAFWLLVCLGPPAVLLLVWRAPTPTVGELLYNANHPDNDGRP
jgi:hypothetical protein